MAEIKKKTIVHILAGEIRVQATKNDNKVDVKLSWSPKNVVGENPPHGTEVEK
jgi:hypothetical protein